MIATDSLRIFRNSLGVSVRRIAQSKVLSILELILCKERLVVTALMIRQLEDQRSSWLPEIYVTT